MSPKEKLCDSVVVNIAKLSTSCLFDTSKSVAASPTKTVLVKLPELALIVPVTFNAPVSEENDK